MKYISVSILLLVLFSCSPTSERGSNIEHGYYNKVSFNPSDTISIMLQPFSNQNNYNLKLYDINDSIIQTVRVNLFMQNSSNSLDFWKEGYGYKETYSYPINNKLKSGIYYFENSSPFIVKQKIKKNKILIVYPSNTDNAYNGNGGRSSYTLPKGDTLNFRRPFTLQSYSKFFLKWIANQNFKADYICDLDLESYNNIKGYKLIIIPGHSEYWTRKARRNFDKYINKGGNSIILSGNTMWWQIRYSKDLSQMICFKVNYINKDTFIYNDSLVIDSLKTTVWTDSILNYQTILSIGVDFKHGGFGNRKDNGWDGYKIINNSPLFTNTGIKVGDTLSIKSAEYDGVPLLFAKNNVAIDTSKIKFYKMNILGYDKAVDGAGNEKNGAFIILKKTKESGIIINTATTNWCSEKGFGGPDSVKIKRLTYNFIDFLLNDKNVFF